MAEKIGGEWLFAPETANVMTALQSGGGTARFVGGCVRNTLLGRRLNDIDIAVDIDPNVVIRLLTNAGIKVIPTGFSHGTVTAVICRKSYEITSLREDTHTDGRRAQVVFTKDWAKDAARRDFTMNALYADADGTVHDFLGTGLQDVGARRVRFIGSASDRIQEDYLRILRFFRFHAHYGEGAMEPGALVACAGLHSGLEIVAKERIGSEILEMLSASHVAVVLEMMEQTGVLEKILPTARVHTPMAVMEALESSFSVAPDPMRRLALITRGGDPRDTGRALVLSNDHMEKLRARRAAPSLIRTTEHARKLGYERGLDAGKDVLLIQHTEDNTKPDSKIILALEEGAAQKLPVTAKDLMAAGVEAGPKLGEMLRKIETLWVDSDFVMDKSTLMGTVCV